MSTEVEAGERALGDGQLESAPGLPAAPVAPAMSTIRRDRSVVVNFVLMALYQIVLRTGWIFKTESIIMPAVLDTIGGPGWLRGCLPMLNRFGQSIPPVLASSAIHASRQKKYVLAASTLAMGLAFLALATIWWANGGEQVWWLPLVFLMLYALFFASTGINQLTLGTLTGKLIPVAGRGRLMLVASSIGTVSAVLCAGLLLPHWLGQRAANFLAIFAFTGILFVLAAVVVLLLVESPDRFPKSTNSPRHLFGAAARALAEDRDLRRLAIIGALFGMSLTLFPHYQALGRTRLDLGLDALLPWVITQNVGVALLSIPAGWLADRYGNRLVLQLLLAIVCGVPLLALALSRIEELGELGFSLVFVLLGATPVTIRSLTNYCLELAPRPEQPKYLSTLSLCTAGPAILTAPLLGGLVDAIGFGPIFLLVVCCLLAAWLMTLNMIEPRTTSRANSAREC